MMVYVKVSYAFFFFLEPSEARPVYNYGNRLWRAPALAADACAKTLNFFKINFQASKWAKRKSRAPPPSAPGPQRTQSVTLCVFLSSKSFHLQSVQVKTFSNFSTRPCSNQFVEFWHSPEQLVMSYSTTGLWDGSNKIRAPSRGTCIERGWWGR